MNPHDRDHGTEVPMPLGNTQSSAPALPPLPPFGVIRTALEGAGIIFRDNDLIRGLVVPSTAQTYLLSLGNSNAHVQPLVSIMLDGYGFDTKRRVRSGENEDGAVWYSQDKESESPNGGSPGTSPSSSSSASETITTSEQFERLKDSFFALAEGIAGAKRPGYTQANPDVLHNFKTTAKRIGIAPLQAWGVHFEKHVSAIMSYAMSSGIPQAEPIHGRFADALNYLSLGLALVAEENPAVAEALGA